ncbi:MAG TPA: HD domain-containing protein [Terriglobia bacterium]|nr:HD domain-containing protein [Terriglobia bacterium]
MRKLANLLFELGRLKRIERSGWSMARVHQRVESVAEHTCRTAFIAYFLAVLEGANPERTASMALFHDAGEARTGDADGLARLALGNGRQAEHDAIESQFDNDVPGGRQIRELLHEFCLRQSLEARIAKDADVIECEIQAREYEAGAFLDMLRTHEKVNCDSSRKLLEAVRKVSPDEWWQALRSPKC